MKRRPNLLFIQVDQMHHQALSAYGNPYVKTPHLDRMVREGFSFLNSYSVMPQCCPARAAWFTGRSSKESGVMVNDMPVRDELPDLGQWLRNAGYETVYTGKWHVSGRTCRDSFDVLLSSQPESPFGELTDPLVTRSALGWLQNRPVSDQPFFLNVSYLAPHDCCFRAGAGGEVLGKYAMASVFREEMPPVPENFKSSSGYGRGWSRSDWQYYAYQYYRECEAVDAEIGLVMDAVRNSPYARNTLILLTSDHGDGLGFHGKLSKGFLEEESWRVPMIFWGSDIPAGVRDSEHLASGYDVAATFCDYAESPPLPKTGFGRSLRPLLEKKKAEWRDYVVGETSVPYLGVSFRDARGTKTIFYSDGKIDVYDLNRDPLEQNNLSENPEAKEIIERHKAYFSDYLSRVDPAPMPDTVPEGRRHLYDYLEWYAAMKEELRVSQ